MISTTILLGEDKEPICYEDAFRLDVGLATKLIEAFNAVNGLGSKKNRLTDDDTVWHELVLCGVGGKTVAEAKANLSYREAHDWFTFAQQRGGSNAYRPTSRDSRHTDKSPCWWRS